MASSSKVKFKMNLNRILHDIFLLITCVIIKISAKESTEENANHASLPYTLNSKGSTKDSRGDSYPHFLILNKDDGESSNVEKLEIERGKRLSSNDNHQDWKRLSTFVSPYAAHKHTAFGNSDYLWNHLDNIPQTTNALNGPTGGFLLTTILYYLHLGILSYILFGIGALLNRLLTFGDLLKPPLTFTSADGGGFYKNT